MPATTDVIRGALKLDNFQEGRVYTDTDAFILAIAEMFSVEIPTTITNVIVSSAQPGDDFKEGVWIRKDASGSFNGIYIFQSGAWEQIVPPLFDNEVILMYGDSRSIPNGYSLADTTNSNLPSGVGAKLMIDWLWDGSHYSLFHIIKD
jgi:hypothetical protein